MLIEGALVNALAFTGSSYLFHRLSADNIDTERKRHNAAIEALQKAQIEWTHKHQQRIHFINNQLRLERKAETKFTELNEAMREYRETIKMEETRKQPSKSEVIASFIGMGMVGFCFGIGLMGLCSDPEPCGGPVLAVKTVNNLECCINRRSL